VAIYPTVLSQSDVSAHYSAGISVVPEPSIYAMAFAGLACGSYSMYRRRKRA